MKFLHKIDEWYMGFLFWATSSKIAAYVLTILILVSVKMDPPQNIQAALLVVVSVYYQGVALPALGAGSKRAEAAAKEEGAITRELLQETHDTVLEELSIVKEELQVAKEDRDALRQVINGQSDMMAEMEEVIQELQSLTQELHRYHIGGSGDVA